jgi:hypothetical protein
LAASRSRHLPERRIILPPACMPNVCSADLLALERTSPLRSTAANDMPLRPNTAPFEVQPAAAAWP